MYNKHLVGEKKLVHQCFDWGKRGWSMKWCLYIQTITVGQVGEAILYFLAVGL